MTEFSPTVLVDPEDGSSYDISTPEALAEAQSYGWRKETREEIANRAAKEVVKEYPITSGVAAFTGQALNQIGLGIPKLVRDNTGSEDSKMLSRATDKAITEEHPNLNIAGGAMGMGLLFTAPGVSQTLGTLGDAAVQATGKVAALGGETAAKALTSKLAQSAVKFGAENAAINVPYRITEEMLGDPNIASEGILAGAAQDFALGAAFGGVTSLVPSVVKGVADFAKNHTPGIVSDVFSPANLKEKADLALFKQVGGLTSELRKLDLVTSEPTLAGQLKAVKNLVKANATEVDIVRGPEAVFNKTKAAELAAGNDLTSLRATADKYGFQLPYTSVDDSLNAVRNEYTKGDLSVAEQVRPGAVPVRASSQEIIEQAIKKYGPDERRWGPEVADAIQNGTGLPEGGAVIPGMEFRDPSRIPDVKAIDAYRDVLQSAAKRKMVAQGLSDEQIAQAFHTREGLPSFSADEMHSLRQSAKSVLKKNENAILLDTDGAMDAWNVVSKAMDQGIDAALKAGGLSRESSAFLKANDRWRRLMLLNDKVLEPAATRAMSRNSVGLGTMVAATAGAAAGGGVGLLKGAALGYAKQHGGNYLASHVLGTAAKVLEGYNGHIGEAVSRMLTPGVKSAVKATTLGSVGIFSRYAGEGKQDEQTAAKSFINDLQLASSDLAKQAEVLDGITGLAEHAPQNFALMGAGLLRANQYLLDAAPKPPPPLFPGGPVPEWKIPDNELSKWSRKVDAVFNPMIIINEIKSGLLSAESVDAVKTVYPALYQALQTELMKKLANAPASQVAKLKAKLGLLIPSGADPNKTAEQVQILQGGFADDKSKVKPNTNSKITQSGRMTTDLNRVLNQ